MKYFSDDFIQFFKDLATNNNKEWFDANRKRYEQSVKEPFARFVADIIDAFFVDNPEQKIQIKDAIFRINRDIRFSKDKTPYKTQMSAIINEGGKKNKTTPGMYVELGPENIRLYSGAHLLEKDQLYGLRSYIAKHLDEFDKAINDEDFKNTFGEIQGEKNKKLPPEFMEAANKQPLLFNKSFYYFAKLDPKLITSDQLLSSLMDYYHRAKPVGDFLTKGLEA